MTQPPKLQTYQGNLYFFYAGPFRSASEAHDEIDSLFARGEIDSLFARGEIDASDDALMVHRSIYLRD